MHELSIRKATTADLATVIDRRLAFLCDVRSMGRDELDGAAEAATREFVESTHAEGTLHTWLAEGDGRCVGLVSLLLYRMPPRPDELRLVEGYVINMYVQPSARSQGIGRALFEACLGAGPELGIRRFFLHSTDNGRPLYEASGFRSSDEWLYLDVP